MVEAAIAESGGGRDVSGMRRLSVAEKENGSRPDAVLSERERNESRDEGLFAVYHQDREQKENHERGIE